MSAELLDREGPEKEEAPRAANSEGLQESKSGCGPETNNSSPEGGAQVDNAEKEREILDGLDWALFDEFPAGSYNGAIMVSAAGALRNMESDNYADVRNRNGRINYGTVANTLIQNINNDLEIENQNREKREKFTKLKDLPVSVIALVIRRMEKVVKINIGRIVTQQYDAVPVNIYVDDPKDERFGTYTDLRQYFDDISLRLNPGLNKAQRSEVVELLAATREVRIIEDPCYVGLIPAKNGIYNRQTGELLPYDPKYVFTSKRPINFVRDAPEPAIVDEYDNDGYVFRPSEWLKNLSDDVEVQAFLTEMLSMAIRPYECTGKSIWLYAPDGSNGKGTLLQVMGEMLGAENYTTFNIKGFENDFQAAMRATKLGNFADENDPSGYIDQVSTWKSSVTGERVSLNPKHQQIFMARFYGLDIQPSNGFPRFKDKSGSLTRRITIIPFDKTFQGEKEKKHIKHDYLFRQEVLEWFFYNACVHPCTKLSTPKVSESLLDKFREFNDPVDQWFIDIQDGLSSMPFIPNGLAQAWFTAWYNRNIGGAKVGRNTFMESWRASAKRMGFWADRTDRESTKVKITDDMYMVANPSFSDACKEYGYNTDMALWVKGGNEAIRTGGQLFVKPLRAFDRGMLRIRPFEEEE